MTDRDVEMEAARRLLEQDEAATASPVADAAVRAAMERMWRTAAALRAWRKSHESMPAPVIVPVASNVSRRWQFIGAAAAAAAIIVVGIAVGVLSRESRGDSNKLAADLAWAGKTAPVAPAGPFARMEFDTQGQGFGSEGGVAGAPGKMTGAPGILDGGPGSLGAAPAKGGARGGPPDDSQPPELDAFIRQFAFAFRIPQQLPGGWEFERGRPISESRVQLIYRRGDQTLSAFVSPAGSGDLEFRGVDIGGRKMSAGRRGGLAIAFEGGQADPKIWNDIAKELTVTKGKTP
jgi:hypothetical protein